MSFPIGTSNPIILLLRAIYTGKVEESVRLGRLIGRKGITRLSRSQG